MEKKIKIALCGMRGHLDYFGELINSYPESEVIAVWDPDPETAAKAAALFPGCAACTDYDALLQVPDLSAVVITYHNVWHKELACKAAAVGKHIFLEKPLASSLDDAIAIRDAVQSAGIKFYMTDPFCNGATAYVKNFIRSGKLGKLLSVRIRFSNNSRVFRAPSPEDVRIEVGRMGGGMMTDTGGHPLHVLHYLLGKPERVYAQFAWRSADDKAAGNEEYIAMLMQYPDDVTAIVESGMISPGYTSGIEVNGTRGTIIQEGIHDWHTPVRYRLTDLVPPDTGTGRPQDRSEWVTVDPADLPQDPDDHARYFVRMIAEDLPNDGVGTDVRSLHGMNLQDAMELMEIREAIYESARTGNSAPVPTV